ncbi:MAG: TonB-dependent receptor [Muribaculaceae bacterium]|nr:TonB-dependent receptor [Muribaculaceae bacterium]
MKRLSTLVLSIVTVCTAAMAGGLMTNTNHHLAFNRMMARGASFEIDGAYTNPAGLVWGHEGWQLSFNWQYAKQSRDIKSLFPVNPTEDHIIEHKGTVDAPFIPDLYVAYNNNRWAFSFFGGFVGGGGKAHFTDGVSMFNIPVMLGLMQYQITPDMYTIDSDVKGTQYVVGLQANAAYRINDHFSASAGFRVNRLLANYKGFVLTSAIPQIGSIDMQLDCDQRGWGFNPIIGVDYRLNDLTLAAHYEFRTKITATNKTKTLYDSSNSGSLEKAGFGDGMKSRCDMPSLLSVAAGYAFSPRVRAQLEYHFYDDKHAKLSNDRQEFLDRGTNEILAGVEWDINDMFTVSCGGQRTDYGLTEGKSDNFQNDMSFSCDSYSVGLGGAINVNEHMRVNAGCFWTIYSDYDKKVVYGTMEGTNTYSRTNRSLGIGIDYKF